MTKFYAVKKGRKTGIFNTWDECKEYTANFSGAVFKSFKTKKEAIEYLGDVYSEYEISYIQENSLKKSIDENEDSYNKKNIVEYHTDEEDVFKSMSSNEMIAYIDGSYEHSKKYFAYAGIMFYNNISEDFAYADSDEYLISMRNVSGEVKASMYVIQKAVDYGLEKITIYYDYTGIENWAVGNWKTNNQLTKSYRDFCKEMSKKIDINFIKVKSHTNIKFNDYVDKLAKKAIENAML